VAPLEPDQIAEVRPAEAGIGPAAGEMHRVVDCVAPGNEFRDPILRIIVDPEQPGTRAA
jgi:hypothetical protein